MPHKENGNQASSYASPADRQELTFEGGYVNMKCEICCKNEAVYNMYRINKDLSKDWLNVCPKCEGKIGMENMKRGKR